MSPFRDGCLAAAPSTAAAPSSPAAPSSQSSTSAAAPRRIRTLAHRIWLQGARRGTAAWPRPAARVRTAGWLRLTAMRSVRLPVTNVCSTTACLGLRCASVCD